MDEIEVHVPSSLRPLWTFESGHQKLLDTGSPIQGPLPLRVGPPALLGALDMVHGVFEREARRGKGRAVRLWPWSRMTGWRAVHAVMRAAGLDGPQASPKGLRHGFGVSAGIPLNLVQKWLGHAQLTTTTAIYADAVGAEEKDIAKGGGGELSAEAPIALAPILGADMIATCGSSLWGR